MKQRVKITRDGLYYPQYKWLFWWRHYRYENTLGWAGTTWKERQGKIVWANTDVSALEYLDKKYADSIAKQTVAWISWNKPQ